jgi:GxxExxY protein
MDTNQTGLLEKEEVYAIVGAAMEVHNELGAGFAEAVYQEAMEIELGLRAVPFVRQPRLLVHYKGVQLSNYYVADFICYGRVVVEIKAIRETTKREAAQTINQLKATGLRVGLLINFGDPGQLDWERFVF